MDVNICDELDSTFFFFATIFLGAALCVVDLTALRPLLQHPSAD